MPIYPPYRSWPPNPYDRWVAPTPVPTARPTPLAPFPAYTRRTIDINAAGPFRPPSTGEIVEQGSGGGAPPGFSDAPWDGSTYGRNNGQWSHVIDCGVF